MLGGSSPDAGGAFIEDLKRTLRELGWTEGRGIVYEVRWAHGDADRLPALAKELVALRPDLIYTVFTNAALAAPQVTTTIPIVIAGSADPVRAGLAESLARPGGNVTGLSNATDVLGAKSLEMLRTVMPRLGRVGVMWNPKNPGGSGLVLEGVERGAHALGIAPVSVQATTPAEIDDAFTRLQRERVDALIVASDSLFLVNRQRIGELAASRGWRDFHRRTRVCRLGRSAQL